MIRSLLSIHDVMPHNLSSIQQLLDACIDSGHEKVTLLVVPGLAWSQHGIKQLQRWSEMGFELAAHGWIHQCQSIRGWKHHVHSRLISRNVAEHLCLSSNEIIELIQSSARWFALHDLPEPFLYVPPAWALGNVKSDDLCQLSTPMIETTTGVIDTKSNQRIRLPLAGFEADTKLRKWILRTTNFASQLASRVTEKPLRIGIHPNDHRLKLRSDLLRMLAWYGEGLFYRELVRSSSTVQASLIDENATNPAPGV